MADNNSCAGALVAAGAVRTSGSKTTTNNRKERGRALRESMSLKTNPRSLTPSQLGLSNNSPSSSPSDIGLDQPQTITPLQANFRSTSSQPRKVTVRHLTAALIRHHLGRADPLAVRKVGKLYRHHRNPERALGLFLLRRLLWRTSRRPATTMDFIDQIRRLQADEFSSDEESGAVLTAATIRGGKSRPSVVKAAKVTFTNQQAAKSEVPVGKGKRSSATNGAATENESVGKVKGTEPAKEAKGTETVGQAKGTEAAEKGTGSGAEGDSRPQKNAQVTLAKASVKAEPASKVNGTTQSKKRPLDDETPTAVGQHQQQQQHAAKKAKSAPGDRPPAPHAPAEATPESSTAGALAGAPAPAPQPTSPSPPKKQKQNKKPLREMEFFERRVHDMLADPLGFDDCVAPTSRPIPRDMARSFAHYRRKQKPAPPLVMSGAIGRVVVGGGAAGGDAARAGKEKSGKGKESLSRAARVRAHERSVEQRVRGSGERGTAGMREDGRPVVNGHVNGDSSRQTDRSKADGSKGKGNDLGWSMGAGKQGVKQHNGGQHPKRSREMR